MIVVVMGVSSAGKSRIARALKQRTGWRFLEGDSLHPPSNREKMAAGTPLSDDDRWPWLDLIGGELAGSASRGEALIVTCSALKRAYRERLRSHAPSVRFLFLHGPEALLRRRMEGRRGHFMPVTLLPSQLATLEMPGEDESDVVRLDIDQPVGRIVTRFLEETRS
ncbi:MAG: gluconokinase [Minwuia sp.]|uniref:gluconokinase n=1 Tax=Minwuia sp. TaxID=2493630 RepID=UPI003A852D8D